MNKLSVAIITFNEERNIERCLKSVLPVADEIVVVDSLSTDNTEAICRKYNVTFVKQAFLGYVEQKNFAVKYCSNDFVLSLDADEALSETLQQSILEVKKNPVKDGYSFNRATFYCGQHIKHGGWYPDKSLRLWNRTKGEWKGNNPHDWFCLIDGADCGYIKGDLLHYSFASIDEHIAQINKFSTISAQSKFKKGVRSYWFQILLFPKWRFFHNYILKRGFLDGYFGFIIAVNSAHEVFIKYSKLRNLWETAK